jgi:hypothetical protein
LAHEPHTVEGRTAPATGNHGPTVTVQAAVRNVRLALVALAALALLSAGCLGSSANRAAAKHPRAVSPVVTPAYARFTVELRHARFSITCASPRTYRQMRGILSWQARECIAIVDFQTAAHGSGSACPCPLSALSVHVRGTIQGRPVDDRFTTCMCGYGKRAAHDVRVILTTAPPPVTVGPLG